MGLFHRREQPQTEIPYTISVSSEHTRLVIGLGNPGAQYDHTRHNVGFACVNAFVAAEQGTWTEKKPLKCLLSELRIGQTRVIVCKPQTFMNLSGEAVQAVQRYFKLTNAQTVLLYDDSAIKYGQIRTRTGGSSAGHNGVKSVIQHCGEDFHRIKVGVGNEFSDKKDMAEFVLERFTKQELESMNTLTTEVTSLINEFVFGDSFPTETRRFLNK